MTTTKRRTGVTHKKKVTSRKQKPKRKVIAKAKARKKLAAKGKRISKAEFVGKMNKLVKRKVARKRQAVTKPKGPILVGFCLDETGSMADRHSVTISSYNEYVDGLAHAGGDVRFWLLRFNSAKMDTSVRGVAALDIPRLTPATYTPAENTPLYDAIAMLIEEMDLQATRVKTSPLVVILTDGEENASRRYDRQAIFDMIAKRTTLGWTFVYLGVGSDSWEEWRNLGISPGNVAKAAGTVRGMSVGMDAVMMASTAYVNRGGQQTSCFYTIPKGSHNVKLGTEPEAPTTVDDDSTPVDPSTTSN